MNTCFYMTAGACLRDMLVSASALLRVPGATAEVNSICSTTTITVLFSLVNSRFERGGG